MSVLLEEGSARLSSTDSLHEMVIRFNRYNQSVAEAVESFVLCTYNNHQIGKREKATRR